MMCDDVDDHSKLIKSTIKDELDNADSKRMESDTDFKEDLKSKTARMTDDNCH